MPETIGIGAAPAATACAVEAGGVATFCATLFCAGVTIGMAVVAGEVAEAVTDDDVTGLDAVVDEEAAGDESIPVAENDDDDAKDEPTEALVAFVD